MIIRQLVLHPSSAGITTGTTTSFINSSIGLSTANVNAGTQFIQLVNNNDLKRVTGFGATFVTVANQVAVVVKVLVLQLHS